MRFKSKTNHGFTIYAVTGVNTASFAIDFDKTKIEGLLGFAVERACSQENEKYFLPGFKVFENVIPLPTTDIQVSTFEHPIQSFVWDDFTLKDGYEYTYYFYPLKGTPKNLDRSLSPVEINIKTELSFDANSEHQVFFNRGVMSSQAYLRRFKNLAPNKILDPVKKEEAYNWLSRDLLKGINKFIESAEKDETLLGCFYEFRYNKVAIAFKNAKQKKVKVKIIVDFKDNEKSFPKDDNKKILGEHDLLDNAIFRTSDKNYIQHNKFIILLDKNKKPKSVWTGSTNISEGGIFGHTNVGHWINNVEVATNYKKYWDILKENPELDEARKEIMKIQSDLSTNDLLNMPNGIKCIFSPRTNQAMLKTYADLLDNSKDLGAITLAFGINKEFKDKLIDNTQDDALIFLLLEKEDKATEKNKATFKSLKSKNNVYTSFGSYISDNLNRWNRETNQKITKLNGHVTYVHSKFLMIDPLGKSPILVTGSANFSKNSTIYNDENMVIIKGNKRTSDIYFTEFNRLFNHYYFRSIYNKTIEENKKSMSNSLFLIPDDSWLTKYKDGSLRHKRIQVFKNMHI
jgi:phosphatidylserine/phosphatidylglycerophosphate/cardiolipin synthase-like enzyme